MGGLFRYDGFLFQLISKIVDGIWLGILWIVFSIPIITIGASTTALYYAVHKTIRLDEGKVTAEFWGAFKRNFKQATHVWLILILLYAFLIIDCHLAFTFYTLGAVPKGIAIGFVVCIGIVIMWTSYMFPLVARFENKTSRVFANSMHLLIQNIFKSVVLLALFLIVAYLSLAFPELILVTPVCYMWLSSSMIEKIFEKNISIQEELEEG